MRAERLTRALGGTWHGGYGMACCPAHNDRTPSLSIRDGDGKRVLLYCHAGCEYGGIRAAIERRLGFGAQGEIGVLQLGRTPKSAQQVNRDLVERVWANTHAIVGSHAETYLRARAFTGSLPAALRYHPALRHPSGARFPAMVARVDDLNRKLVALHRTYLDQVVPGKAVVTPSKAMLGPCGGHAVHLRAGSSCIVVCEGIETGLSLCDAVEPDHAVWAALSASGMRKLNLPLPNAFSRSLVVAVDGDKAGRYAGEALAERAAYLGWRVRIACPPDGLDFNDVARGGGNV
ncbi:MAG: toprim domain-containing protein [Pseudomonadota bacterium]